MVHDPIPSEWGFPRRHLSPLFFLITFNSIIELAQSLQTLRFHSSLSNHYSHSLLGIKFIYALWDTEHSEESNNWYLVKIIAICPNGTTTFYYCKSKSFETTYQSKGYTVATSLWKWFSQLRVCPQLSVQTSQSERFC